jgi:hypothetical protein
MGDTCGPRSALQFLAADRSGCGIYAAIAIAGLRVVDSSRLHYAGRPSLRQAAKRVKKSEIKPIRTFAHLHICTLNPLPTQRFQ